MACIEELPCAWESLTKMAHVKLSINILLRFCKKCKGNSVSVNLFYYSTSVLKIPLPFLTEFACPYQQKCWSRQEYRPSLGATWPVESWAKLTEKLGRRWFECLHENESEKEVLGTVDNFSLGRRACGLVNVHQYCKNAASLLTQIYFGHATLVKKATRRLPGRRHWIACSSFVSMSSCLLPVATSLPSIDASHFYFLQPGCATAAKRKRVSAHWWWLHSQHTSFACRTCARRCGRWWWPEMQAFKCALTSKTACDVLLETLL